MLVYLNQPHYVLDQGWPNCSTNATSGTCSRANLSVGNLGEASTPDHMDWLSTNTATEPGLAQATGHPPAGHSGAVLVALALDLGNWQLTSLP